MCFKYFFFVLRQQDEQGKKTIIHHLEREYGSGWDHNQVLQDMRQTMKHRRDNARYLFNFGASLHNSENSIYYSLRFWFRYSNFVLIKGLILMDGGNTFRNYIMFNLTQRFCINHSNHFEGQGFFMVHDLVCRP